MLSGNRGDNIVQREIIDVITVYPTDKMNVSSKMKKALNIESPCTLILEYNDTGEIVIRANELNNTKKKKKGR